MKMTMKQLKRFILNEVHPRAEIDNQYVRDLEIREDELATQIRHATGDLYGNKNMYDLEGKSVEELEDIIYDLGNSLEQTAIDDMYRDEEEGLMGRDSDMSAAEMAPRRQGFGRRPAGVKSQRRMESSISRSRLKRIIKENTQYNY